MNKTIATFWSSNKSFVLFVLLMFSFRSAIADWNEVPTGSMKPTIIEGDRLWINKLAYDVKVPLTNLSLVSLSAPERGDIIIFESKKADERLVKRVIGLPGDKVAMINNKLIINNKVLAYEHVENSTTDYYEQLGNSRHKIRVNPQGSTLSSFNTVVVPEAQYLVLGDNRDNSADSRVIGFVPREEIIGRSRHVVISLDYDNYYLPRGERFLDIL